MSTPSLPACLPLAGHKSKANWNAAQTDEISTWIEALLANSLTHAIIHALIHSFTWLINSIEQRKLSPAEAGAGAGPVCKQIGRLNEMNIHLSDCLLCNAFADISLCVIRVICSAAKELRIWHGACNKEGRGMQRRRALTIYSENQFECNTNAINKCSLCQCDTHTHTYTSVNMSYTQAHVHSLTACTVCASCAVFNFLWPTETITINITQARHVLCPRSALPPFLSFPSALSTLPWYAVPPACSLSRIKNAIRIDIDANEKCQLFSRVGKESKLCAHSKQFEHEYEYECEYECYTWQKNRDTNQEREIKSKRERTIVLTLSTLNSFSFSFYSRI